MMLFSLADRLHKSIDEVLDWPYETIVEWQEYHRVIDKGSSDGVQNTQDKVKGG